MKFISVVSVGKRPDQPPRNLFVWRGFLWMALIMVGLLGVGVWKTTHTYIEFGYYRGLYFLASRENRSIKKEIHAFDQMLHALQAKMAYWFDLDDKVRSVYEMQPIHQEERRVGTGGFTKNALDERRAKSVDEKHMNLLSRHVDVLYRQADLQTYQFDYIKEHISKKNHYWAHYPSIWPTRGRVTSEFGYRLHPIVGYRCMHEGLDIAAVTGTPVVAAANGIVHLSGYNGRFGNMLIIQHGYRYSTVYGHLQQILVRSGQVVKRGDLVGYVGRTGMATGPHLHYEVRVGARPMNPRSFILPVSYVVD